MGQIKLLSKSISNKIAAGEVVERPLSVVKELIENAIDAQATAVSIDITSGGIKEIIVTDNGIGIDAKDVELAFEKHATSKISTEKDLNYIHTQGFRGEALSSIAAVSVVDMKTNRKQDELGTHIRITGGRVDDISPAGLPDGTSVCVSNLFFNVPARLSFLKKPAQEAAYITDLISRYILAFPEIAFHYRAQGKTIYHSAGMGDLKAAIYTVYGGGIMDNIINVQSETNGIKVSGYVSRAGTVMKNRRAGSVFVNRRYVRSTSLHDMVKSAYGEALVKGEFPFFALNIDLPVSAVDVNVHPNKLQVRFNDTAAVEHVIKEAVSSASKNICGTVDFNIPKQTVPDTNSVQHSVEMRSEQVQTELFSGFSRSTLKEETQPESTHTNSLPLQSEDELPERIPPTRPVTIESNTVQSYRLIGSFGNAYILVEQGENLLLIDQHAAHERLIYNTIKAQPSPVSQMLLAPSVLTVSHAQKNVIDDNIDIFNELGFDIAEFGALEYKVSAVPSVAFGVSVTALINDALHEISKGGSDIVLRRESIIRAACRSAVKAGDKLSNPEFESLINDFLQSDVMPTCPHGRPVISVITKKQIEKSFKRIL